MKTFIPKQGIMLPYYWRAGKLLDRRIVDPVVPTFSQAMDYSVLIIEGIRLNVTADKKCIGFRFDDHLKRLISSWENMNFECPYSLKELRTGLVACVQKNIEYMRETNQLQSLYIRPKIYAPSGHIKPLAISEVEVIIECFPFGNYLPGGGVTATLADYVRTHRYSGYTTKGAGKYCEYGMLRDSRHGEYDDVLQLGIGHGGKLIFTEGTTNNVFFVHRGILMTPGKNDFILLGITRDTVLQLAKFAGLKIKEGDVGLSTIVECEEAFVTGTASFITPITKLGRFEMPVGPVTQKLMKLFAEAREGKIAKFKKWLTVFKSRVMSKSS